MTPQERLLAAALKDVERAIATERAAIIKELEFLLKEHAANKSEARGLQMAIGVIKSRASK